MDVTTTTSVVQIGQVWEELRGRNKGRQINVQIINNEGTTEETVTATILGAEGGLIDMKTDKLTTAYKLVLRTDGSPVMEDPDLADVPVFGGDAEVISNQLITVGAQFDLDSVSLTAHGKPPITAFEQAFERLGQAQESVNYYLGDLVNLGESLYGEEAAQIIDNKHLDEKSVRTYQWVCKRVQPSERLVAQSFSHAQTVAALGRADQHKWLEKSRGEDWSVAKLKFEVASATELGRTKLQFVLIVNCVTEAKQEKLAKELESEGFVVTKRQSVARIKKVKKEKKARAVKTRGPVDAVSSRRGRPKKAAATKAKRQYTRRA